MAVIISSFPSRLVMPETTLEVQEHGAFRKWWVQKMCQFLDTRKTCCHKNSIKEPIRIPGLPTNASVADNEATLSSCEHQPDFWQLGPRDQEEEEGERRHLLQTFLSLCLSYSGAPSLEVVLSSCFLRILPRLVQFPHGSQASQLVPSFGLRQNSHSFLAAGKQAD